MNRLEDIGDQIIAAVGRGGATELLDAITRPEALRAALIGRLSRGTMQRGSPNS